ncbi:MAG TPA: hypothetical protein ENG63_08925 [Candidatus Desulfofervidus auxilii]|uniref:Uncharacterized protein n=1 Tax=Desulfofervidus auxilii TaxID=1621989 RepID=A0A7C0U3T7_DESA2|nr:hypothetical protein [Candidatus Desulfofervidus auxilii]
MNINHVKLFKERIILRALVISLTLVFAAFALLYVSARKDWLEGYEVWRIVMQQLGGSLFIIGTVALLWEIFGRRAFLDEILAKAQISKEIAFSGIIKITNSFHHGIDWKSYFRTVKELDIFFAYGRTWRSTYAQELREVASREHTQIRVVLPDPEDKHTVFELAKRFNCAPEKLKDLIKEAETQFKSLCSSKDSKGGQVKIWFLPMAPSFTFYRFDHVGILALYSHRQERVRIPTFVCESGGTLYDYICEELDAMIRPDGLAKLIYDSSQKVI